MTAYFRVRGLIGVRVGRIYVSARSSDHRAYFSERNRIKCHVLPLPFGWRLLVRF